ncbi:MAG: DUF6966 domain-containing protein [Planctomycetota bacterium]|jgi:hypothetical protein
MTFAVAIKGLIHLLDAVGDVGWQPQLREHLRIWEQTGGAGAHLSIYGGMGSFNDVVICVLNHHKVSSELEPFVNAAFNSLSSICYTFAGENRFRPKDLDGPPSRVLRGWACCACSFSEVSGRNIDTFLSHHLVDPMLLKGMRAGDVTSTMDSILSLEIAGLRNARETTREKVVRSGISFCDREGWMRPCPSCGSSDTCVYRWDDHGNAFAPSANNLKLKKK